MLGKIAVAIIAVLAGMIITRVILDRNSKRTQKPAGKRPAKRVGGNADKAETLVYDKKTGTWKPEE